MIRRSVPGPASNFEPLDSWVPSALGAWFVPAAIQFDDRDPLLGVMSGEVVRCGAVGRADR